MRWTFTASSSRTSASASPRTTASQWAISSPQPLTFGRALNSSSTCAPSRCRQRGGGAVMAPHAPPDVQEAAPGGGGPLVERAPGRDAQASQGGGLGVVALAQVAALHGPLD